MLVNTDVGMAGYNGHEVAAMPRRMIGAMETIPGVTSVALVCILHCISVGTKRMSLVTKRRICDHRMPLLEVSSQHIARILPGGGHCLAVRKSLNLA
jgi:hypothetical protein